LPSSDPAKLTIDAVGVHFWQATQVAANALFSLAENVLGNCFLLQWRFGASVTIGREEQIRIQSRVELRSLSETDESDFMLLKSTIIWLWASTDRSPP
jgi:hypothetical protein